jgi:purine-nucleoside phosphorylase
MSSQLPIPDKAREAVAEIRRRANSRPEVGIILGSGLAALSDEVERRQAIPYAEIPHFPVSTIEGHPGQLVLGGWSGQAVMVLQGRAHYYEGYLPQEITLPVRAMQLLGVHTLIVTNAAGGLNLSYRPGDLMLIHDHINLVGMAGANPLRGANLDSLGPRFPDMSQAYDPTLRTLAHRVAERLGLTLWEGVYAYVAGPSFETPAEVRFLRIIGADAVGMSTAPEVTVARHASMRVLGISGISNVAISEPSQDRQTTHHEVLEAGKTIVPRLGMLIGGVLSEMAPPQ